MAIYQARTDIDYFEAEDGQGDYQYVTLEQVVTDYMMSMSADDYSVGTPRYKVLYQAKRMLQELSYDVLNEIRAIELELSPRLTVTVPPDFVNFVRISWVDDVGLLHPMAIDSRMNLASAYLQDNNFDLLYGNDGEVLEGSGVRDRVTDESQLPRTRRPFCNNDGGFAPNAPLQVIFMNGRVNFNKSEGILEFGSEVSGKNIVLEYISDGLFTGTVGNTARNAESNIRIHKFAEKAIHDGITVELIKNRRNVPNYAVKEAKKEAGNSKRIAKRRINTLRKTDLLQAMKGSSKWIKS